VMLNISCPQNVYPGDRMYMTKNLADGRWSIKNVVRNELPKVVLEKSGMVQRKTATQLAADLADPTICMVELETSKGPIKLRIAPAWSPKGAQRFLQLVTNRYYTDLPVYRAVPEFLIQFGVTDDTARSGAYEAIKDDYPRGVPVEDGSICFAAAGPDTRTSTICIFLAAFDELGRNPWETPIGKVCPESMGVLHSIFTGYGDPASREVGGMGSGAGHAVLGERHAYLLFPHGTEQEARKNARTLPITRASQESRASGGPTKSSASKLRDEPGGSIGLLRRFVAVLKLYE
ncbi:unnamed protein product, partial [Prorocentrum cordatum]